MNNAPCRPEQASEFSGVVRRRSGGSTQEGHMNVRRFGGHRWHPLTRFTIFSKETMPVYTCTTTTSMLTANIKRVYLI
jgi:hypothetical protein